MRAKKNPISILVDFLHMVRFSHTLFALPFALSAVAIIAVRYNADIVLTWQNVLLIVVAFTGMRSFAMAFNRFTDHKLDALNPRTQSREIPAGKLSVATVLLFAFVSLLVMVVAAFFLSPLAGYLSLPAALIVLGYSYSKRFTWLCHFWLGLAIGLAPTAVYIALLQTVHAEALFLSAALCFYIAGFDILYALQDHAFDKKHDLYSVPVRFGVIGALWISRLSHILSLAFVAAVFLVLQMPWAVWPGFSVLALLLAYEHYLVGSSENVRYEKIPVAFFNVNSVFSLAFLAVICLGLWT